jgi:hypothetical protein
MSELIRQRSKSSELDFSKSAVNAFERTYSVLFEQALTEADRLQRINGAMTALEQELLDPDRIAQMDNSQKLMVFDLLTRTSNTSIKNLMGFGQLFMNIKTVVSILENTKTSTIIEQIQDDVLDIEFTSEDYEGIDFK